jgi:hypothetical protein
LVPVVTAIADQIANPTELSRQHAADFIQDRFGHSEGDFTRARQLYRQ